MWIPSVVFGLCFVVGVLRDPRRMRCAIFGLLTVASLFFWGLMFLLPHDSSDKYGPYILLVLIIVIIVTIVLLGVVLILNGFVMVRKEGRRLANLLGLILGVVMVSYVVLVLWAIVDNQIQWFVWVILVGFPMVFLGFGFLGFLLYSRIYLAATKRWAKPPDAVIILGSGLINNHVPPLLASRLEAGIALFKAPNRDQEPLLIVSGGMGSDEARSEASAMSEYLVGAGIPADQIIEENQSTTTKENISLTKELLSERGFTGRVATVTNNFHAFRSAMLLSRAKMLGHGIGSPTARYYWPAAVIREYAAVLLDSLGFVVVGLCVSALPPVFFALMKILGAVQ
jgi:uncharacterized SAM-binding protein YcdF (DUF218 family)